MSHLWKSRRWDRLTLTRSTWGIFRLQVRSKSGTAVMYHTGGSDPGAHQTYQRYTLDQSVQFQVEILPNMSKNDEAPFTWRK